MTPVSLSVIGKVVQGHDFLFAGTKVEDSRHVYKPPDAGEDPHGSDGKPTSKTEMESFLDDLLS